MIVKNLYTRVGLVSLAVYSLILHLVTPYVLRVSQKEVRLIDPTTWEDHLERRQSYYFTNGYDVERQVKNLTKISSAWQLVIYVHFD